MNIVWGFLYSRQMACSSLGLCSCLGPIKKGVEKGDRLCGSFGERQIWPSFLLNSDSWASYFNFSGPVSKGSYTNWHLEPVYNWSSGVLSSRRCLLSWLFNFQGSQSVVPGPEICRALWDLVRKADAGAPDLLAQKFKSGFSCVLYQTLQVNLGHS